MRMNVRNAGKAAPGSDQSICTTCWHIMNPTTTSAGATASNGTRWMSGERNTAARKNRPVNTEARPVRAPSPMPVPDSTKIWCAEPEAPPPTATASASAASTRFRSGMEPSGFTVPASRARPTETPIASKNTESRIANTSREAISPPTEVKAPNRSTLPSRCRSGAVHSGREGAIRDQPVGTAFPSASTEGPMWNTASSTLARIVAATMPIRMAPRTLRITRTAVSSSPTTKTSTGQPSSSPPVPRPTGTVVSAASGSRRTNPALTRPISAMNRPMPTTMPDFSASGTASNTARRKPVTTSSSITRPARVTRPISWGQVSPGVVAMVMETNAETPRPAATANGCRAHTPMTMVMMPATSAVTAATAGMPRVFPAESGPDRISGFSTTM